MLNPQNDHNPRLTVGGFLFQNILRIFVEILKIMDFSKDLILLRGLPGSGKSTLGEVILYLPNNNLKPLSEDDYFIMRDGTYNFNFEKLKEAHNDCQQRCANLMMNGVIRIVVANTFTQEWEMKPYFEMAERYGYRVHSLIVENRHGGNNIHGVPDEKLEIMKNRFDVKL